MTTGELVRRLQSLDPKGKLPVMIATDDGRTITGRLALHVYGVPVRQDSHAVSELDASLQDGRHRNYVLALRAERIAETSVAIFSFDRSGAVLRLQVPRP
jgi:hypothetical protein